MRRTFSGFQLSLAAMAALLIALITATTVAAQSAPMPGGPTKEFSYTDADLASRLRAKNYFPIAEMGAEADKAVFAAVCGG